MQPQVPGSGLEATTSAKPANGTSAPPDPASADSSAPSAAPAATAGQGIDVAWLRIQHLALPGAAGCRTGPAAGHERLPGLPSAAVLAAAARRQAEQGPPDTAVLAAAAAAAATATAAQAGTGVAASAIPVDAGAPAAVGSSGSDVAASGHGTDTAMAEAAERPSTAPAAPAAPAGGAGAEGAVASAPSTAGSLGVSSEDLGPPLQLRSFALEVNAVPASSAVRDAVAYARLASTFDAKGLPYAGWRVADVVPLATVLRRALPLVLSRQLGVASAAPQSADVTVSVAVLDGSSGLAEIRALLEDQAAQSSRRNANQHQQQHKRPDKRQRQQQQQQRQAGQGGAGSAGEPHQNGHGGNGTIYDRHVAQVMVPEERVRGTTFDQATAALAGMPRHVVQRLFPGPPPGQSPAQKEGTPAATTSTSPAGATGAAGGAATATEDAAGPAPAAAAAGPAASSSGVGDTAVANPGPTAPADGPGVSVHVRAVHAPLLLAGRYCKLRRHMPQCPWFVLSTGERIGGTSVQEAIEDFVLPLYGTGVAKMVTGGREDADVRMLGSGRPFVLEVQAPLRGHPPAETFRRVEERMRSSKCGAAVQGLTPCTAASLEAIKAAEDSKEKTYRALCWAARAVVPEHLAALEAMGRVEVAQDTPVRVLHRRAAKVRPKWIEVEKATPVPDQPNYLVLQLRTQAGTYVKEFCHGDFGRCQPSLGDLLGRIRSKISEAAGAAGEAGAAADADAIRAAAAAAAAAAVATAAAAVAASDGKPAVTKGSGGGSAGGAMSGHYEHVEIVQLDVLDVHLEDWP